MSVISENPIFQNPVLLKNFCNAKHWLGFCLAKVLLTDAYCTWETLLHSSQLCSIMLCRKLIPFWHFLKLTPVWRFYPCTPTVCWYIETYPTLCISALSIASAFSMTSRILSCSLEDIGSGWFHLFKLAVLTDQPECNLEHIINHVMCLCLCLVSKVTPTALTSADRYKGLIVQTKAPTTSVLTNHSLVARFLLHNVGPKIWYFLLTKYSKFHLIQPRIIQPATLTSNFGKFRISMKCKIPEYYNQTSATFAGKLPHKISNHQTSHDFTYSC